MRGSLRISARSPGDRIWLAAGHTPMLWEGRDARAADALLDETGAGLALTGTSDIDEPGDRLLWLAARRRGIPAHAMLDHPANLSQRFRCDDGTVVYPDWIYAPDAIFAERLAEARVPRDRIRIIGDLHHMRVARLAARRTPGDIVALRGAWGAKPGDSVLLFASECVREMKAKGRPSPYDEMTVLEELLRSLARAERPDGATIDPAATLVVIRPHPRDADGKYESVVHASSGKPRVVTSTAGSADLALMAADFVVGMNSSLLYEAVAIGRPVASLTGHNLSAGKSSRRMMLPTNVAANVHLGKCVLA